MSAAPEAQSNASARCISLIGVPTDIGAGTLGARMGTEADADSRVALRAEFSNRIRAAGMATLLVTHDQTEASSMADRCVRLTPG